MTAGLDPDQFGHQTPRRLRIILEAADRRFARDHDLAIKAAWHAAVIGRLEKVPDLKTLFLGYRPEPQSAETIMAHARMWLGGGEA